MAGFIAIQVYSSVYFYKRESVYSIDKICGIRAEFLAKK